MKIYCLGDSLTEGDYGIAGKSGIGNVKPENYPYFLSCISGWEVTNLGRCGATPVSYLDFLTGEKADLSDADAVILMLGSNGKMESATGNAELEAYFKIIDHCKASAPDAVLFLCTPPHAAEDPSYSNSGYMPRIRRAAEAVREAAAVTGHRLIDVFAYPEICEENVPKYQSADGLHFNEAGYRLLAEYIYSGIIPYCKA